MKSFRPPTPAAPQPSLIQRARTWAIKPTGCSTCSKIRAAASRVIGKPKG